MNLTQRKIIALLNDGLCHSGNALGQALGISRSAIWKQINQLVDLGVPIASIAHQGYQLQKQLILLDEALISEALREGGFSKAFNVEVYTSIDSTNRYVKDLPLNNRVEICCAESQTQGRGRFNRHWHSPFGENIYCSSRWNLHCDLARLSGLSLITSLAIVATVREFGAKDVGIKWPNDLLWQDKKLSGNLIEINAESNGSAQVIIGIGLNTNSDTKNNPLPDKVWCSLFEIIGKGFDRNTVITRLLLQLDKYLDKFITHGLTAFLAEWQSCDYLIGKKVSVTQGSQSVSGIACGIDSAGLLVIEDETGKTHKLSSGDTTFS